MASKYSNHLNTEHLKSESSKLVYQVLKHAVLFCFTWMTTCVHFRKCESWSFRTGISVKEWRVAEKDKKRKECQNILQKQCLHTVNGQTNRHYVCTHCF